MKRGLSLLACVILCLAFIPVQADTAAPKIELLDENLDLVTGKLWIDCNVGYRVTQKGATAIEWKLSGPHTGASDTVDESFVPDPEDENQRVLSWKNGVLVIFPFLGPYEDAGDYVFSARSKVGGKWSAWGELKFRIYKKGDLREPEFTFPESIELGEDLTFTIKQAKDTKGNNVKVLYSVSIAWNDWNNYYYKEYKEPGTYTIPGNKLTDTGIHYVHVAYDAKGYHHVWNECELNVKPATIYHVSDGSVKLALNRATKTATVTGPKNKNAKSIKINATCKYQGNTYRITGIDANAFKNCRKLTKAEIGKNVIEIGANAFSGCSKLDSLVIKTTKLTAKGIGKNAFKTGCAKGKVKCPKGKANEYQKILQKKGLKKGMKCSE